MPLRGHDALDIITYRPRSTEGGDKAWAILR
jgi:hypothetical protein